MTVSPRSNVPARWSPGWPAEASRSPSNSVQLARSGIELVADDVEGEEVVPELLEIGVRLAQGFAFAIPVPMDALAARGERRPEPPAEPMAERDTLLSLRDYLRRAR